MKYYLKINNYSYPNVSQLVCNDPYRSEVVSTDIGGNITIDRIGSAKFTLSASMNALSQIEMNNLLDAVQYGTENQVQFYYGNILKTIQARIVPFEVPAPIYHYCDRTKGITYPSFTIQIEEV